MLSSILIFILGGLTVALFPYGLHYVRRRSKSDKTDKSVYNLDHGMLNLELPPKHMWMNMGYWESTTSFPEACENLLRKVLLHAGLLGDDKPITPANSLTSLPYNMTMLDLGIGCGDQSIFLTGLTHPRDSTRPLFTRYIGVTNNQAQYELARRRLMQHHGLDDTDSDADQLLNIKGQTIGIFCEDAADPERWSHALRRAVEFRGDPRSSTHVDDPPPTSTIWVLGLDCLYHFKPSRLPLFYYARHTLNATLLSFDLLITDQPISSAQSAALWFMGLLTGTPRRNLMQRADYLAQLRAAGYALENESHEKVTMHDITNHVFAPLARFIREQEQDLMRIGVKDFGGFGWAGRLFNWWAESGLVRGYIVIARA